MEAALTALGYICEEGVESEAVGAYLEKFSTQILHAVGAGMTSPNQDVQYYATNALCNSMEFIHNNMSQQEQRDYLVRLVCNVVSNCPKEETREKGMECLVKVADLYYQSLPNYINELHTITTKAIFGDEESVALQAVLFWITICEDESEMDKSQCHGLAAQGAPLLVEMCLKLLVQQVEDQTEEDWNRSIAAGKLLQSLAECINNSIQGLVMPFVYANINSQSWRECEAAIMAFGCILGGPEPSTIQDTVAQAIPGLLNYVRHSNSLIADTAGWVLGVVCELFPDAFLGDQQQLVAFMNIIGPMISGPDPSKSQRASTCINNLALAYEDEEAQSTNELSPYFMDLVKALLTAIDNQSPVFVKARANAQESLNTLVDAAADDCCAVLTELVPELLQRLRRLTSQTGDVKAVELQGLICGALGAVAKKIRFGISPYTRDIMQVVTGLLQINRGNRSAVMGEVFVLIGSIAVAAEGGIYPCAFRPHQSPTQETSSRSP